MLHIDYDSLPAEVATFRDFLTLAVKYPERGSLLAHIESDLKLMEDFLAVNHGANFTKITDYYARTKDVHDFVLRYITDDGKPGGVCGFA